MQGGNIWLDRASSAAGRIGSAITLRRIYATLIACTYFLLTLHTGSSQDPVGSDSSWSLVMAWAFQHHLQWGKDIAFTYGPLGFLHPLSTYYPATHSVYYIAQLLLTAGQALIFTQVALRLNGIIAALFLASLLYWSHFLWADAAVFASMTMIVVLASNRLASKPSRIHVAATGLLFLFASVYAWVKFTWLILWLCAAATIAVRAYLRDGPRQAAATAAIAIAATLGVWVASGQSLAALPHFLRLGFEISSAYSSAMSYTPGPLTEILGVGAAISCLVAMALLLRGRSDLQRVALALFCGFALFLLWHATYTRADGHVEQLFPAAALLPFVLLADSDVSPSGVTRTAAVASALLVTVCGAVVINYSPALALRVMAPTISNNFGAVRHPLVRRGLLDQVWQHYASQHQIPKIRQRVGNRTIDLLMTSQGLLLLNDLNYVPRPVFQSYTAYTPLLARANEAYFLDARAPDFVLLGFEPIDDRYPAEEDSLALVALLRRYKPVLSESGYLLLERTAAAPAASPPAADAAAAVDARFGEFVDVPMADGKPLMLFADVELSPLGKLYTFLFREPALMMSAEVSGGTREFRFLRGLGASGFMIAPTLLGNEDYLKITAGMPPVRITRLGLHPAIGWQRVMFRSAFRFRFVQMPAFPLFATSEDVGQFAFPNFSPTPSAAQGQIRTITENGIRSVFMHAPATLTYNLAVGDYRLEGKYGITAAAYTQATCPDADGIDFVVTVAGSQNSKIYMKGHTDPFHNPKDRGDRNINIPLIRIGEGDHLELAIQPAGNLACDWGYVHDIRVTRIEKAD